MSPDAVPPMDPDRLAVLLGQAVGGLEPDPGGMNRIRSGITRRHRVHQGALVALTVLAVTGISVAGAALRTSSSPAVVGTAPSGSLAPSFPPTAVPSPTGGGLAARPVPPGFSAASVSAIDADTWWVGGSVPCGSADRCPALATTADAGHTFRSITLPDLGRLSGLAGPTVRFATSLSGWVYGSSSTGSYLLATHDGGTSWAAQPMTISAGLVRLEAAGGRVYALVRTPATKTAEYLYAAPVTGDSWTLLATPHPENGYRAGFAVVGPSIWIEGAAGSGGGGPPPRALYLSHDHGLTFSTLKDPCTAELGGSFEAHAAGVVWAFCATGMQGLPYLSVDDGRTFAAVAARGMWSNATGVAAISAFVGFLYGNGVQATRDGGRTFSSVDLGRTGDTVLFVGFTDDVHGFVVTGSGALLRSDDAGLSFHPVAVG